MVRSLFSIASILALAAAPAWAAFGYTTSGNLVTVDTAGGLVATVDMSTGDITSMLFNGIQAQDQGGKHSQIGSGIGASCGITTIGNYIKVHRPGNSFCSALHFIRLLAQQQISFITTYSNTRMLVSDAFSPTACHRCATALSISLSPRVSHRPFSSFTFGVVPTS